ncbi:MAG TPA: hypothetical protein VHW45_09925 [Candidatus Sulfotelmatobacter sp.]|jgi:hypothetical protein|nr:hypothetical protein [Candidatus Sulfotelmatobacter sp.]
MFIAKMLVPKRPLAVFPVLALWVMLALPAVLICAQEQTPPAQPTDQKPATPDSRPTPPPKPRDDSVGKSKIEKETGTVNDRIFDVLPNYGTVEGKKSLQPLTSGQKFRLATASVFDWGAYPFNAALSAIGQAKNDPASWGQGWGAYAKRYGANFADNSIGTYNTVAIYPSLLHEDPRYYQMGKGEMFHRFGYGLSRLFVTKTDSGDTRFNYSEIAGNATAAAISNIYHAPEDRTAARNASTLGFLILYDGLANELKEFWPDIRRKVLHKTNP